MRTFQRILVAIDQNDRSEAPLRLACELAHRTGGEVVVFHSISEDEREDREHLPPPSNYVDVMVEETKRDLEALMSSLATEGDPPPYRVISLVGEPAEQIRSLADAEDCDLIVVGLRRRSKVGKFLLGSHLQDVLMTAERPVIAVPLATGDD